MSSSIPYHLISITTELLGTITQNTLSKDFAFLIFFSGFIQDFLLGREVFCRKRLAVLSFFLYIIITSKDRSSHQDFKPQGMSPLSSVFLTFYTVYK